MESNGSHLVAHKNNSTTNSTSNSPRSNETQCSCHASKQHPNKDDCDHCGTSNQIHVPVTSTDTSLTSFTSELKCSKLTDSTGSNLSNSQQHSSKQQVIWYDKPSNIMMYNGMSPQASSLRDKKHISPSDRYAPPKNK